MESQSFTRDSTEFAGVPAEMQCPGEAALTRSWRIKGMRTIVVAALVLWAGLALAGDGAPFVPIAYFDDPDSNEALALELSTYSPDYFEAMAPGFDKSDPVGVVYGFHRVAETRQVGLELIALGPERSRERMQEEARQALARFLPTLARDHVAKRPLFARLRPMGEKWISTFSGDAIDLMCGDVTIGPDDNMTEEGLREFADFCARSTGEVTDIRFEQGQYYRPHDGRNEMVSLFYRVQAQYKGEILIRLDLVRGGDDWCVQGTSIGAQYEAGG